MQQKKHYQPLEVITVDGIVTTRTSRPQAALGSYAGAAATMVRAPECSTSTTTMAAATVTVPPARFCLPRKRRVKRGVFPLGTCQNKMCKLKRVYTKLCK